METKSAKRVPRFHGFRIYFFSTILYYWLVLPFLLILTIKYAPALRDQSFSGSRLENRRPITLPNSPDTLDLIIDSLINKTLGENVPVMPEEKQDTSRGPKILLGNSGVTLTTEDGTEESIGGDDNTQIGRAFNLMLNMFLVSFFLGFLFNLPFKRYFSKKRKGKTIPVKLFNFTKRLLLKSPLINAGILGIAFIVTHSFMLYTLLQADAFGNDWEKSLYVHLFYISLTASVLSLMFVYFWEKHRVHIRYIEHIYSAEELRKRIFNLKVGRIRNRMFLSSAMTTLLPLTIVILYLFLSISYLSDLKYEEYTEDQKNILFGDYTMFRDIFSDSDNSLNIPDWLFYINAINSFFMFIGIYSSIFIAFVYILFLVKWTTQDIVHPVKELLNNMRKTGQGELDNFSIVRTNDEIGELTEGYNEMTQRIGNYIDNISEMTKAYSYFVPRQFLDFLGKESFVDIKLGDQVEKEMTVLFSDIRSFTELSEQMTPKENFDFINYYLGYMEPVIRHNNGFIDKYIGDSIMALFSESGEDAINASIEMRIKLSQFNQVMDQFGKPSINSGIGIHSGKLMLGVVGGEGRMDGTVISDSVNTAARLEGLTKVYGSSIIISQDTLIKLNNPSQYNYRFLDIVKVKGKKEAVYIFEIIDGDSEDVRNLKLKTKNQFAEGINLYKSQKFSEALKIFNGVFEINQHDVTAGLYISRCKKMLEHGVPKDWDGIETIDWN
jgi:class 3 adenylate cyclase